MVSLSSRLLPETVNSLNLSPFQYSYQNIFVPPFFFLLDDKSKSKKFLLCFLSLYPSWVTRNRMVPLCLVLKPNYSRGFILVLFCSSLQSQLLSVGDVFRACFFPLLSSNEIIEEKKLGQPLVNPLVAPMNPCLVS